MKKALLTGAIIFACLGLAEKSASQPGNNKPGLVVGITADPMGYDWIEKYWEFLGPGGLKKLIAQGATFENTSLNHYIGGTSTSHASLSTGSTPYQHGIIANSWYHRLRQEETNSTKDYAFNTVGSNSHFGRHSPRQLLIPTFGDALKNSPSSESKVISISLKPEAAVLMAGYLADGVYWFDPSSGNWVSSTAYCQTLPDWARNFNNRSRADYFLSEDWDLFLPTSNYANCLPDNQEFEIGLGDNLKSFPYKMQRLQRASLNRDYEILLKTPAGNSLTTEFAISAIYNAGLGLDKHTDLLLISYSAISGLIQRFGPESMEVMDAVVRLDDEISRLLFVLEEQVGKEKVVVFFTATHGSSWNVDYAISRGLPAGRFRSRNAIALTNSYLSAIYGENMWVESYINQQIYLDQTLVDQNHISLPEIQEKAARFLNQFDGVASALPSDRMVNTSIIRSEGSVIQNSFYASRSGDISIVLKPGWIEDGDQVADFRSPYPYDTRIPLIWWGMGLSNKIIYEKAGIQDIAATIFDMLGITFPFSGSGTSLLHLIQKP